jgi:hypothetical protein
LPQADQPDDCVELEAEDDWLAFELDHWLLLELVA